MKKTLGMALVALLAIATVTSIAIFSNKEDALADFRTKKHARESTINNTVTTIMYTTDKQCTISYDSEEWRCRQCFNFTLQSEVINRCIYLPEDGNATSDEATVKEAVRNEIEQRIPKDKVSYTAREVEGQTVSLEKKSAIK